MTQHHLFHKHDPPTSSEAIDNHKASGAHQTHMQLVLKAVKCYPGLTACEIAEKIRLKEYQVRRRLSELKRDGKIKYGERRMCSVKGTGMMTWEAV